MPPRDRWVCGVEVKVELEIVAELKGHQADAD